MVLSVKELYSSLKSSAVDKFDSISIEYNEVSVCVSADKIKDFLIFLKDDPKLRFIQLIDLCGVDYPSRVKRFDVVYHLMSFHENCRIRVRVKTDENSPVLSICDLFPAANWFEREAFDMYGIVFEGNPDMRRILTDYGFAGYPLRKDFPVTGYVELRYDEELKRVVYDKVSLTQDFRSFDFLSPWEGAKYVMPSKELEDT